MAALDSKSSRPPNTPGVPIVVLGTDAVLAVQPATPVQLAHACLKAGFASVIPASWGDELIAAATLRELVRRPPGPAIQCSCPRVAHRLLTVGGDLRPTMLSFVAPPVAVARYLRAIAAPARPRITYIGSCAGALDDSIDVRMSAQALIELLAERQLRVDEQPRVFESVIPADRRRFHSQAGGMPSAEALWNEAGHRALVELSAEDLSVELAQHLLGGANALIDAAPTLGCVCSGATADGPCDEARARIAALEPPRAQSPVVDETVPLDLRLPLPAAPRVPIDISARPLGTAPQPVRDTDERSATPPRGTGVAAGGAGESRPRLSSAYRAPVTVAPGARESGRLLPRAYVARRRSSPHGLKAIRDEEAAAIEVARSPRSTTETPSMTLQPAVRGPGAAPWSPADIGGTRKLLLLVIIAAIIISIASATIGVLVGRAIVERTPAAAATR